MDLALSASAPQLEALVAFGAADRLLFGTDFPYAAESNIKLNTKLLKTYIKTSPKGKLLSEAKLTSNTISLFKKHGIDTSNPEV